MNASGDGRQGYDGCLEFDARLLESVFSPSPDAELEAHLKTCSRCQRARDLYLVTSDALAGVSGDARPPFGQTTRRRSRRILRLVRVQAAAALLLVGTVIATMLLIEDDSEPTVDGVHADSGEHSQVFAGGSREYRVDGRELRVRTPCGTVLCRGGVFQIDVERTVVPTSWRRETMKRASMVTAAVTLTVTSGVVWWIVNGESVQVPPGTSVVQEGRVDSPDPLPAVGGSSSGELETVPFRAEGAETATVEVLSHDGQRVARAHVIAFDGGRVIADGRTRSDGRAVFASRSEPAEVLVVAPGRPPFRASLSLKSGVQTVHLPAGAAVSGRLRMADGKLPDGLSVRLRGKHASSLLTALPPAVLERARLRSGKEAAGIRAHVGKDGSFGFGGLPATWTGFLDLPRGYRLAYAEGYERALELEHPRERLDLSLLPMPAIRGRVVTSDGSAPVPRARLRVEKRWSRSGFSGRVVRADGKGRFEIPIEQPGLAFVRLGVSDADGGATAIVTLDEGLEEVTDLGDVPLARVNVVRFIVRDTDGRPIEGAVATAAGSGPDAVSGPTAGDGSGELLAPHGIEKLTVVAMGCSPKDVHVPERVASPLVVTLERGTSLKVRVTSPGGAVPRGVNVFLKGKDSLFENESDRVVRAISKAGATMYLLAMSGGRGGATYSYRPNDKGEVLLSDLRHGVPMKLSARGQDGTIVAEETFTLEAAEHREIVLRVNKAPRALVGSIADESGRRLVGATITLDIASLNRTSQIVKDDGTFRFEGIFSDNVDITVKCPGYAPLVEADLALPAEDRPVELVMRPGRTVRLLVVDTSGRPQNDSHVIVFTPGRPRRFLKSGRTDEDGVLRLENLPEGKVKLEAYVANATYPLVHDTSKPEARIEVPARGVVEASWDVDLKDNRRWHIELVPEDERGKRVRFTSRDAMRKATITGVRPGRYTAVLRQRASAAGTFDTVATSARPFSVRSDGPTAVRLVR